MKNVIVTGASSGIGEATAVGLANAGWEVTGIARQFGANHKGKMRGVSLDLSDIDTLSQALKELDLPTPHSLVLNAGVGLFGGLEQLSETHIRRTLDLNLVSPILLIKHFLPKMKLNSGGDIVLVGSEAALAGAKQGAVYCASKFALRGFAQSLRADCAKAGIRVILVNPGPTATDFFDDLHFEPKAGENNVLQAEDVASVIVNALSSPGNVVHEEINVQPMTRSFQTKAK